MATNKRSLESADREISIPSHKKRKLNEENAPNESESLSRFATVPFTTASPSMNPSAQPNESQHQTETEAVMSAPIVNPSINEINIDINNNINENNNQKKEKSFHMPNLNLPNKSLDCSPPSSISADIKNKKQNTDNNKNEDNKIANENKKEIANTAKANNNNNNSEDNNNMSNWKFKASDFTFGDNSWVRQTSNISNISNISATDTDTQETIANEDSYSQFAGLGFQKVLNQNENENENENQATITTTNNDKKEKENTNTNDNDSNTNSNAWGGVWSTTNSNNDGTFKLNFNWGSWDSPNAKIDLNPSTTVGWESQAPKYDPNEIHINKETERVVAEMGGEKDSGDGNDSTTYCIHCKVYNLDDGQYIERGKGMVKLNTYNSDGNGGKTLKARILCRRDQILTNIINAPILKEMKFEKIGSFIRFGVVEVMDNKSNVNEKIDGKNSNSKDGMEKKKEENENNDDSEDIDLKINTQIKTFLVKPLDRTKIDTLLNKIKDIQKQIN